MDRWIAVVLIAATVVNSAFMGLILWLYRQIRLQHTVDLWYMNPLVGAELALSMQLEALQVMLIVIGLGLTGLGAFGFKSIRDAAEEEARRLAAEVAAEAAAKTMESSYARQLREANQLLREANRRLREAREPDVPDVPDMPDLDVSDSEQEGDSQQEG